MKLTNGGHARLQAPEGDAHLADFSIIAPEGSSAAVYLSASDCLRLSHVLGEMGDGLAGDERERVMHALVERVRHNSKDSGFCIVCMGDKLKNGEGFDHHEGCPIAQLEVLP